MTVRAQIFLFVAPLFIGCGAIGSLLASSLESRALERAFHDETRGLAAVLSEFIEPGDVASLAAGKPIGDTRLADVLRRLNRWSLLKRFYLIDAASGRRLADSSPSDGALPSPAAWRRLAPDDVLILPLRPTSSGGMSQPFLALAAGGDAVLGGEISALDYLGAQRRISEDANNDIAISAVIGLLAAAGIAAFVGREIAGLRGTVEKIGTPEFPREPPGSVIKEVDDLGNIMNVMNSVLSDTVDKTRSLMLESEYYRSGRGLAGALQAELQVAAIPSGGGVDAAWFSGGEASWLSSDGIPPAAFAGLLERDSERGIAFVGAAGFSDELDPVLRSEAARAYLADMLVREKPEAAGAAAADLFGVTRLAIAWWDRETLWQWSLAAAEPVATAWPARTLAALSCLGRVNRERMAVYLLNFPSRSPAQAVAELPAIFDPAGPGAALLIRRIELKSIDAPMTGS